MERERFELKVGIFVFVAIAALGALVLTVSSQQEMFSRTYTLYCEFDQVAGLKNGAPVRLAGLDVGIVDGIEFPDEPGKKELRVRLQVRTEARNRIREDSKASIATQGVLGDKYIAVSLGTTGEPVAKNSLLPSEQPRDYAALVESAGETMAHVKSIAAKLDQMLTGDASEETKKSVTGFVGAATDMMNEIRTGDGLLHKLIYDPEAAKTLDNLHVASANLAAVTSDVRAGKGALGTLVADPETKEQLKKALAAMASFEKASADLAATSGSLRNVAATIERGDGTVGALINDPQVYDDLVALLGGAKRNKILRGVIRRTIEKNEKVDKTSAPVEEMKAPPKP